MGSSRSAFTICTISTPWEESFWAAGEDGVSCDVANAVGGIFEEALGNGFALAACYSDHDDDFCHFRLFWLRGSNGSVIRSAGQLKRPFNNEALKRPNWTKMSKA
jgi:hypothetical protein